MIEDGAFDSFGDFGDFQSAGSEASPPTGADSWSFASASSAGSYDEGGRGADTVKDHAERTAQN